MWIAAELVVKSYLVDQLEKGMLFLNILHPGTEKQTYEIFSLDRVPRDEQAFLALNGYPVEFSIVFEEKEIANHSQIGWFDFGEQVGLHKAAITLRMIGRKAAVFVQVDRSDLVEIKIGFVVPVDQRPINTKRS